MGPAAASLILLLAFLGDPGEEREEAFLLRVSSTLCTAGPLPAEALASLLALSPPQSDEESVPREGFLRRHIELPLPDPSSETGGGLLEVTSLAGPDGLIRLETVYYEPAETGPRPRLLLVSGRDCRPLEGRRLVYGEERPVSLEILESDLLALKGRELLEPPLVPAPDPGGPLVALVDAGVAYDLPSIAPRLARRPEGTLVGYDFWDLDPLPYDANPALSPFYPQRHGTQVASLLLAEAPEARLAPYRYPRPDMGRMAALVEQAAADGARILALPLGSRRAGDWQAFATAAAAHPEMLFIASAGNDGQDIDRTAVYPASLPLENLLVVSSCEADGRLAQGSNWGRDSVDLLVPAERVSVLDHLGRERLASGTSYAVPRLAALAARLAGKHPEWHAVELKAAIIARAEPTPQQPSPVKHGWIADPASD